MQDFLEKCFESILQGNKEQAIELAEKSIELQFDPLKVIDDGFIRGVKKVGELWEEGTYFLPELSRFFFKKTFKEKNRAK